MKSELNDTLESSREGLANKMHEFIDACIWPDESGAVTESAVIIHVNRNESIHNVRAYTLNLTSEEADAVVRALAACLMEKPDADEVLN